MAAIMTGVPLCGCQTQSPAVIELGARQCVTGRCHWPFCSVTLVPHGGEGGGPPIKLLMFAPTTARFVCGKRTSGGRALLLHARARVGLGATMHGGTIRVRHAWALTGRMTARS